MLLLYTAQAELHFVLTRRRPDLTAHPGQISFPGGRNEAPEALEVTALRETEEEIGIPAKAIKIMGALTPIYIPPSDFHVYPFVGRVARRGRPSFTPEPGEVAEIIEVPLAPLLAPEVRVEEWRDLGGQHMVVPHFAMNGHKVWGATAIILSEFVERLRGVVSPP
jgi:8-oxo-dGTP pyrophosphatase MutT (NUDIX family)